MLEAFKKSSPRWMPAADVFFGDWEIAASLPGWISQRICAVPSATNASREIL